MDTSDIQDNSYVDKFFEELTCSGTGAILPSMYDKIGEALKDARTKAGLSFRKAQDASGVDHAYIIEIERGDHNSGLDVIERLAVAYGVTLKKILKDAGIC